MSTENHSKISSKDLSRNFQEIIPALTKQEAMEESNRCLYCYDAPCVKACPTGIDIPSFIKKIASGNLKGSAKTILTANPIGASCARVCPTEELCEGSCVLNHSTKPIMIGNLQRYATDWAIQNEQSLFSPGQKNGKKVAIVGGGPAGLSAARELALLGYEVTIFEAEEKAGGLNTYGIVAFRLPLHISYWEVKQIESLNVEIRTNTRVGKDISVQEILKTYDAIILAIGMSKVPELGISGEDLSGVFDAIEFVRETKTKPICSQLLGKKVAVIGAGNTAIDAATSSVRLGADNVKILYRRTSEEMTAYEFEYDFAKQDGVEFRWLTAPVRILGDAHGNVNGIECIKMELAEPGEDGRRSPVPIKGTEFILEVDAVIKANGQSRYVELVEQFHLEHNGGVVKINPSNYQTSNQKVFACGDVIFGKGQQGDAMVVSAVQQGKESAYSIHQLLSPSIVETA
ncbi:glutamate synthase (NADPH/NADH) small chain [Neobacillus bataviensis]|uniref:Glutamate synthase (NADPH/NADH) small chain n=1 Tax=Neobacillus bataviensis TaxID=220685 RepID=A0A561DZ65_9BACI|nr:NAD(P)-dependent oxidoreductase [Neobacillus bataviensis]TWE08612.1 glutamate synthase (NADPH/NADH) small chain [Neobacillus bataviensis]